MTKILFLLVFLLFVSCTHLPENHSPVTTHSRQLILVLTASDSSSRAMLHRFERADSSQPWKSIAAGQPAMIGENGLGWGSGLVKPHFAQLPDKREGDGRSPAGEFTLGSAFGFAPETQMRGLKIPYFQVTDSLECVDDARSKNYNRILRGKDAGNVDWRSSEKMWKIDPQYRLGVVVNFNTDPPKAGAGSCIFLHVWDSPGVSTSGCTAMAPEQMREMVFWLDEEKKPLLVQLTESLYQKLKKDWGLPEIAALNN